MAHRDDGSQVKGFVAKSNTTFKLKDVEVLVESSINQVTACRNRNICIEDVVKYEYYRRIHYLIPDYVSQSESNKITCIC